MYFPGKKSVSGNSQPLAGRKIQYFLQQYTRLPLYTFYWVSLRWGIIERRTVEALEGAIKFEEGGRMFF
jgi:hypothetical protein